MKAIIVILQFVVFVLIDCSVNARADVLDNWTTNQITTNSFALRHVVYGNGLYVATGEWADSGEIFTSVDGYNWTLRYSDGNSWGLTLDFSSGHFSGVGGFGVAVVSTNGTNWTSSFLPSNYFDMTGAPNGQVITYGRTLYVTVGDTNGVGNILTSPDGINWTSRNISPGPGGRISSVAYGPLNFVAIGDNDGFVYTSTGAAAGVVWTQHLIPGGNKISYANGLFIVPLTNQTNLLSLDGINWIQKSTGLTNMIGKVTYSHGLFMTQCGVMVSGNYLASNPVPGSYFATSVDGTNWIQYTRQLPNYWVQPDFSDFDVSLATDGSRLVTVGGAETNVDSYSWNGMVYTSDPLVDIRMTNDPPYGVALSGLVGRNYQIQSASALSASSSNWRTNLTLQLPGTPYVWADYAPTNPARFYRGALLP